MQLLRHGAVGEGGHHGREIEKGPTSSPSRQRSEITPECTACMTCRPLGVEGRRGTSGTNRQEEGVWPRRARLWARRVVARWLGGADNCNESYNKIVESSMILSFVADNFFYLKLFIVQKIDILKILDFVIV